jgi:Phage integrase, N-terminal SAM-like domain
MYPNEKARFDVLYAKHFRALNLQVKAPTTVDVYARAVRRVVERFGCCSDLITVEQSQTHFAELIDTRSWSLVKIDLCGLQFFFKHTLQRPWPWLDIVRPPVKHTLPEVLSLEEIEPNVLAARERRYQTFWWTAYSMCLRLNEALTLRVGASMVRVAWCMCVRERGNVIALSCCTHSLMPACVAIGEIIASRFCSFPGLISAPIFRWIVALARHRELSPV